MATSSSMAPDLSSLLQINQPNQRISFSVRVKNVALPSSCDNIGLPWVHVDVMPSCPLSETMDYRYRPYTVSYGPVWRHQSNLWLDRSFDSSISSEDPECSAEIVDSMEDVYFPIDIPAIACIDLIGCLYCVVSITAGHAPVAAAAIVNSQADDDVCGEDDHLHKRVPRFAGWEPLWTVRVAGSAKFQSLSASSDNKFTKTTIVPHFDGKPPTKPINILRFQMSSARRFDSQMVSPCFPSDLPMTPPAAKRGRVKSKCSNNSNCATVSTSTITTTAATTTAATTITNTATKGKTSKVGSKRSLQAATQPAAEQPGDADGNLINRQHASLDMLPPEIIFQIVASITGVYDQLKVLTVLSSVSRRLRKILSDGSLYSIVDLKPIAGTSRNLTPAFFAFLACRCSNLRSLRLSWIPSLPRGIKLDKIVMSGCLTTVIAQSCPLVDDDFLKILCRSNPGVETLDLSSCWSISRRGFGCLDALRNLRALSLAQTLICQKTLDMLLVKFEKLEVLNLSSCHDITSMDAVCATLSQHSTQLVSLDLSESPSLTPNGLSRLGRGCAKLRELVLFQCSLMTSIAACQTAAMAWHELRRLVVHLTDVNALDMLVVEKESLPFLEQIVVSTFRRNGAPIGVLIRLLSAFPQLSYLKVPIEWPSVTDFEESRAELANLRRNYPKCVIQTQ